MATSPSGPATPACSALSRSPQARHSLLPGLIVLTAFILLPFVGRDFFPPGRCRTVSAARPGGAGTRLECTKVLFSRVEEEFRKVIPANEIELDPRQYRAPGGIVQLCLRRRRDHRHVRRRDPGGVERRRARANRGIRPRTATDTAATFSGSDLLLPAGRHREPDSELRTSRPDRRSGRGLRPGELRDRAKDSQTRSRACPVSWTRTFTR